MSYLPFFFWEGQVWEGVCERECQIPVLLQRLSVLTGFMNKMDPTLNCYTVKSREKPVFWFHFPFPISHGQQVVLISDLNLD